jgi:hypothetical protein
VVHEEEEALGIFACWEALVMDVVVEDRVSLVRSVYRAEVPIQEVGLHGAVTVVDLVDLHRHTSSHEVEVHRGASAVAVAGYTEREEDRHTENVRREVHD